MTSGNLKNQKPFSIICIIAVGVFQDYVTHLSLESIFLAIIYFLKIGVLEI